ncbi:MAG: FtsX-like permease family protein [Candidatus Hodarchaeota archaeon]
MDPNKENIQTKNVMERISELKGKIDEVLDQTKFVLGLVWRNATRSKYRSFLLILGIILTIALETGIVVCTDTLYDDFLLDHRNDNRTDITVNPSLWINQTELERLTKEIRQTSGVSKASPVYYFHASETNILILGIDPKTHPDFPYLRMILGNRKISDQVILISQSIYNMIPIKIGDVITSDMIESWIDEPIPADSSIYDFNITLGGVFIDYHFGNKIGFRTVLVDFETFINVIPENERARILSSEIHVSVKDLLKIRQTSENIEDKLGLGYYVFVEKDISEIRAAGIRAYQAAMNLVIITSFIVEFLFITNILSIAIKDRQKEFGILRALGSNSAQLITIVAMEILFYAIIGSIIGVIMGISLSILLIGLMIDLYKTITFQFIYIHPSSVVATFLSGIIVAIISGLYPIFLMIRTPVIQNIHSRLQKTKSPIQISNWKSIIGVGAALALTGFLLQFFIGPSQLLDFSLLSMHFFIIVVIFVGTVLFEIGVLIFLPRIAYKVLFWFGIATRTISTRNIAREFQKSLITILTSALALSFIIIVGLTSAAVITSVPEYFEDQWSGIDLVGETRDTTLLPTDFTQVLDAREDIIQSSFIQEARTDIGGIFTYVFGVDPIKYDIFSEPVVDSINDRKSSYFLSKTTDEIEPSKNVTYGLISHLLYKRLKPQITLGGDVPIKILDNSTVNVTIGAIIKGNIFLGNGEYLYISSRAFQNYFNSTLAKWFICEVDGKVERVQTSLERDYSAFKDGGIIGISFFTEVIERSLIIQTLLFQVLLVESFILAAITQFVCILVSTLRMEREMGIMRGLGLHKYGVFEIFMSESTALGIAALIVGLCDGILGSFLLIGYISRSIPIQFQINLEQILLWLVFSFVITLFSTVIPSYRSSQKNIVATISGRPMTKSYEEQTLFSYGNQNFYPILEESTKSFQVSTESADYPFFSSFWEFLSDRSRQIKMSFLLLMVLMTLIFVIVDHVYLRGLIPVDYIWGILTQFFIEGYTKNYLRNIMDLFHYISPLMLAISLISIGPLSFYIGHGIIPRKLQKELTRSFFSGILGILLSFTLFTLQIVLLIFFLMITDVLVTEFHFSDLRSVSFLQMIFLTILVVIQLFVFHRVWVYFVFQGAFPDLSVKTKLIWVNRTAPKGQLMFVLLVLCHIFLQSILLITFLPQPIDISRFESSAFGGFAADPLSFLVLSCFETGFFLILIIYQLFQFQKQNLPLIMVNSIKTEQNGST